MAQCGWRGRWASRGGHAFYLGGGYGSRDDVGGGGFLSLAEGLAAICLLQMVREGAPCVIGHFYL